MITCYKQILKKKMFRDLIIQIVRVLNIVYIKEGTFSLTDLLSILFKDIIVKEAIKENVSV